jgi:hypothetical protein
MGRRLARRMWERLGNRTKGEAVKEYRQREAGKEDQRRAEQGKAVRTRLDKRFDRQRGWDRG